MRSGWVKSKANFSETGEGVDNVDGKIRVIHYLNQFFGQIGGEDRAGISPQIIEGPVGPGRLLQNVLEDRGEVVATIICGDDHFANFLASAKKETYQLLKSIKSDILIAGPAFNAGRYGIACGEVCKIAKEALGLCCVTGMFKENPGVELFRKEIFVMETPATAIGMKTSLPKMVSFALKLFKGEPIGIPAEEGYFPRGIRKNVVSDKLASERVIDMLMAKLSGVSYRSEIPAPIEEEAEPAPALKGMEKAKIALVTEGALVPMGNPDNIEGARCTRFSTYEIWSEHDDPARHFQCIHRGFDTSVINQDPNRLIPVDVLSEMHAEGYFGELFPLFYSTCGCGTYLDEAKRIGREISKKLKEAGIDGVILTST